jgi:hypothetical protein
MECKGIECGRRIILDFGYLIAITMIGNKRRREKKRSWWLATANYY